MSNIIRFPKMSEASGNVRAEATPFGVNFSGMNADTGLWEHQKLIDYPSVIRRLDEGEFDDPLSNGLGIVAELAQGEQCGYFTPTTAQRIVIWRWTVAAVFVLGELATNGTVDVADESGGTSKAVMYTGRHGGIVIFPVTERLALANNIEGAAYGQFPATEAQEKALMMYQSMVEAEPGGNGMRLSAWGRETMEMLHDGFIEMLNTEGVPPAPVAH